MCSVYAATPLALSIKRLIWTLMSPVPVFVHRTLFRLARLCKCPVGQTLPIWNSTVFQQQPNWDPAGNFWKSVRTVMNSHPEQSSVMCSEQIKTLLLLACNCICCCFMVSSLGNVNKVNFLPQPPKHFLQDISTSVQRLKVATLWAEQLHVTSEAMIS